MKNYYELVNQLRDNNINAEIFLDSKKNLGKQLTFANKRELPVAVICGEETSLIITLSLLKILKVLKVKIIKQSQKLT